MRAPPSLYVKLTCFQLEPTIVSLSEVSMIAVEHIQEDSSTPERCVVIRYTDGTYHILGSKLLREPEHAAALVDHLYTCLHRDHKSSAKEDEVVPGVRMLKLLTKS
jgi:hypothetical protein